ncbi:4-demethylwyosine synthase TYW1 [Candidatus Woesearchaeota archaeon]|jgi:tRNA wybutosine-synthesizing protein 1|nr:4-demethylwyosine synthase TYW1 [Candidatus Woesearchaeota archaeon]MDP6648297.1 4-demethylwyosine synthase TYW1 [Candidatus Woesearchaeota archaeon]|tara:strand:+ start:11034 stop:11984 length:951 start_codon:yes stop_codon:yes gene_type:complete
MITADVKLMLKKQHYEVVGNHTRVKVCHWTKSELRGQGGCYKKKFYGINSHQCIQMTPTFVCNNACVFCWRDLRYHTQPAMEGDIDNPSDIVEGTLEAQRKLLTGFGGNDSTSKEMFEQSKEPQHVAISLDGEPTLYPRLAELIKEYKKKNFSTFVVSNGLMPERIEKLLEEPPTQLYISVDAPNEELFNIIDRPIIKNAWQGLYKTLSILPKIGENTRIVLRFTLIKGMNMIYPEQWAGIIKLSNPMFVEVKAYMWIGMSRERLEQANMPLHNEVNEFAKEIAKHAGYKVIDEHEPSRVVLLMKQDFEGRVMKFD